MIPSRVHRACGGSCPPGDLDHPDRVELLGDQEHDHEVGARHVVAEHEATLSAELPGSMRIGGDGLERVEDSVDFALRGPGLKPGEYLSAGDLPGQNSAAEVAGQLV